MSSTETTSYLEASLRRKIIKTFGMKEAAKLYDKFQQVKNDQAEVKKLSVKVIKKAGLTAEEFGYLMNKIK